MLSVLAAGKGPVVRITPLTDHDIGEMMEAAGIPAGRGIEELLGRLSQLIEELPWLCGMTARIHDLGVTGQPGGVVLDAGVRIALCRGVRA